MASKWWRMSITFMGAAEDRQDAIRRMGALFDGLPLRNLHLSASPMSEGEVMRALDNDQQVRLTDIAGPSRVVHPYEQDAWIFPDDHPLAPYERLAAQQKDTQALEKLKELMPGDPE